MTLVYGIKLNTVVTSANYTDDMTIVKEINPTRWKIFQVLKIEEENDGRVERTLISESCFDEYIERHLQSLASTSIQVVPENNDAMLGTYAMIDALGRVYTNQNGYYLYSEDTIQRFHSLLEAKVAGFSHEAFEARGGEWDWEARWGWRCEQIYRNRRTRPAEQSTLVDKLSILLDAVQLSCPPEVLIPSIVDGHARSHFDSLNPLQRRAYYRFSNLVASELAAREISHNHVIMDRYWTSTAAFAAMDDGFTHDVELGTYPDELMKPDLLILLTVDEKNRLLRLQGRGEPETQEESELATNKEKRMNVLEAYMAFNPVVLDTSNKSPDQVCIDALKIIQEARCNE